MNEALRLCIQTASEARGNPGGNKEKKVYISLYGIDGVG